jgi:hypothetical protein
LWRGLTNQTIDYRSSAKQLLDRFALVNAIDILIGNEMSTISVDNYGDKTLQNLSYTKLIKIDLLKTILTKNILYFFQSLNAAFPSDKRLCKDC